MINLKLADYSEKKEKFERFLKLGITKKDFAYCGENICVEEGIFKLDEKDPLNRFNGLFDGRTLFDPRDNFLKIKGDYPPEIGLLFGNLHQQPELWQKLK